MNYMKNDSVFKKLGIAQGWGFYRAQAFWGVENVSTMKTVDHSRSKALKRACFNGVVWS